MTYSDSKPKANHSDVLIVYHGTTSVFDKIEITRGKPYKDFGRGFYVTQSKKHAANLATRNKRIEVNRYQRPCDAFLYTYEFDITGLSDYNIKTFRNADLDWLQFVLTNRKARNLIHPYEIVMGPTADDDTMVVINAYLDGLYGEIGSESALNMLLKNIEAENLPGQICFTRNEPTSLLIPKGQVIRL